MLSPPEEKDTTSQFSTIGGGRLSQSSEEGRAALKAPCLSGLSENPEAEEEEDLRRKALKTEKNHPENKGEV